MRHTDGTRHERLSTAIQWVSMIDQEQIQFQEENKSGFDLSGQTTHAALHQVRLCADRIDTTSSHTVRYFPKPIRINSYRLEDGKCYVQCNTLHDKVRRLLIKHKTFLKLKKN